MNVDYVYYSDGKTSTYIEEETLCIEELNGSISRFLKIDSDILQVDNYKELTKLYEIKLLDKKTRLRELKCSKIRVIHFLQDGDTFVYLGCFVKRTNKTPPEEIDKNNKRIKRYMEQKEGK